MLNHSTLLLLPNPREITLSQGSYRFPISGSIVLPSTGEQSSMPAAQKLQAVIKQALNLHLTLSIGTRPTVVSACIFSYVPSLSEQAYEIVIDQSGIVVSYSSPVGAFYAVATLKQIIEQSGRSIPHLQIRDEPDFGARGITVDISRNKIPKQETLYRIIDLMADLKMNQLQLYIEGTPFAYESFPQVWELETPITGEEILLLDAYCKARYIELVPNQNSFGHMEGWLSRPEFNALAEIPEGFMLPKELYMGDVYPEGLFMHPGTFDTEDPAVLPLLEKMFDDLLPYFSSNQFNVGCDETYELGLGKSKALAESQGKGQIYLSFLQKIYELVTKRGKTMQFWGDIIIQHPELIPHLPKDIIAMEWGYSAEHPFESDTLKFREAGIPFYVCPGTSSWNSITGRSDNMFANLRSAAIHGKNNGSIGYLITDWGDHGHWQHLPISYTGYVYGAALSWNVDNNLDVDTAKYLNTFIFADRSEGIGQLLLDLGNYYQLESEIIRSNDTEMSLLLRTNLDNLLIVEKLTEDHFNNLEEYMLSIETRLSGLDLQCDDADLVLKELSNGIHFVKHAVQLGRIKLQLASAPDTIDPNLITEQINDLNVLLHQYRLLWTERNRPGGLDQSIWRLIRLRGQYEALKSE
ncbi:hexosaminidase [Paenibacillus sp. PastF-3]|uniref:family 20 glycosylhydrolase n=1 Tax=Paenibacillus TaxID=44249 RepID=UPI00247562DD|nr:glycoside hydrolase family 20 zincin-like fold domain-containing protein [Paenibacillus sp. PastF-3]MDH6372029.1 hexosaminidase [Paenibacillus sp. PastF-3]